MQERTCFQKLVERVFDRVDPNHEIIITNPENGKRIVIPLNDLKTDFIIRYQLKSLEGPQANP
jgi:hypothetical protein